MVNTVVVQEERLTLRRDVERYRFLLGNISDPALIKLLEEMIAEAEAQLKRIDVRRRTEHSSTVSSRADGKDAPLANAASRMILERFPEIGEWRLDPRTRDARSSAGKTVHLTKGEFDLLLAFVTHPDQVLSRNDLMVLSRHRSEGPGERTIDVLIGRLRRKLEIDPRHPTQIRTVRSEGYVFKL